MFGRKTDKQCAQAAVAAAIVGENLGGTKEVMNMNLTRDEMRRAEAYIKSGKPITGK